MNPALLLALINEIALPELNTWLRERHQAGATITDQDVIDKLKKDTDLGILIGEAWLAAHPVPAP